jgi:hypothetical protein
VFAAKVMDLTDLRELAREQNQPLVTLDPGDGPRVATGTGRFNFQGTLTTDEAAEFPSLALRLVARRKAGPP